MGTVTMRQMPSDITFSDIFDLRRYGRSGRGSDD